MTNNLKLYKGLKKLINDLEIPEDCKINNWFEFKIYLRKNRNGSFSFRDPYLIA